ncbi:hypothetical protein BRADI_2g10412v3 [Brachypodium distachyon]|uniref:Uncharacterized protein n=1 Tax=Brachypodium distachyon TaxID=15368 RepID=A0A2K2D7S7_BRADI|nr:hypothetical protein BRADI_2g10412v3 [Brachypodium distachyon]
MGNPNSKSTALLIVFFLLAIVARQPSSTEASREIKPAYTATVDDLFLLLTARGMVNPAAGDLEEIIIN